MPTVTPVPLPDDANLEQLRKQAKDVRDLARAGIEGALDLVAAHHPKGAHPVTLTGAQMVVARHYGFASWPKLQAHLEMIQAYRRAPDEVEDTTSPGDEFLALACLRYGDDDPDRWKRAAAILADNPGLTSSSIHVAAAACDAEVVGRLVEGDPTAASTEGGPYQWEPLLYLAYARHDPDVSLDATLATARALVEHGADPNAGYLWHGMCPPFTAVTGALGSGEGDQPEHPHGLALARFLLEAGADANDSQALYNRQFGSDDRHLSLLFEYGLGRGDGGLWARRFGPNAESPSEMVRAQLWWAVIHDMTDRVRLLVDHGADIVSPYRTTSGRPASLRTSEGRSPSQVAALSGYPDMARWLAARGSPPPSGEGPDGLVAALLVADRGEVERLQGHLEEVRNQRPALIVWAATGRRPESIRLLVEKGFDINARGRTDIPMEQQWETALHHAASGGDLEMARMLLNLGSDPNIRDNRFHSTPLGWAEHFGRPAMIELLEPRTAPGPE